MATNMAQFDSQIIPKAPNQTPSAIVIRRSSHRKLHLRRRKTPVVRLGGKNRRRLFLVRIFKKFRLRWLKLYYACMLRKLKNYYREVLKDIGDASATLESFQQRAFMQASFAVPVIDVSMASYPNLPGSYRPRTANTFV